MQAGAQGSDLGRLDLVIENGAVKEHHRRLYPLRDSDFPADAHVTHLIEEILAVHRTVLEEPIGHAEDWLVRAQTLAGQEARKRDEQSPVDSLFADILREKTDADLAFLPGVGYGVAIPPGPVTAMQLRQLIPHDGKVVTMQLPGSRVREVLEQAVENVFTDDIDMKVGGMIQVSGLEFAYDPDSPVGKRIVDVQLEGQDWEVDREYVVATNSMLTAGGHNQQAFTHGTDRAEFGLEYEVVKDAFRKRHGIAPPRDVRIRRIRADAPRSLGEAQRSPVTGR